jgi:hypothetical protein
MQIDRGVVRGASSRAAGVTIDDLPKHSPAVFKFNSSVACSGNVFLFQHARIPTKSLSTGQLELIV